MEIPVSTLRELITGSGTQSQSHSGIQNLAPTGQTHIVVLDPKLNAEASAFDASHP